jgi:SAM-dependent methyltransferase
LSRQNNPDAILAARGRANAEGLDARFDEEDAEALPYADASFDVVASLYGAMFAPRPDRVAAELLRVCRPGGTIAMANWTKDGFIGQMFKTFARFIAPTGMPAPVLWGEESVVRERFGAGVSEMRLTRVAYRFDYPFAPADVVEFFRQNYGPTTRAFATLGEADRAGASRGTCGTVDLAQSDQRIRPHGCRRGVPRGRRRSSVNPRQRSR